MNLAVECAEEVLFHSAETIADNSAHVQPRLRGYFDTRTRGYLDICRSWNVEEAARIADEAVFSELPTLVLAGDYDPVTPPAWGRLAAQTLDNVYYVEFPGVAHGVYFARGCAREIVDAFLEAPHATPDTGCLSDMRVGFITR
jgi:pimeloyl-ACP methyl ester carboxylesterase